jgi:membrane protein EpsK
MQRHRSTVPSAKDERLVPTFGEPEKRETDNCHGRQLDFWRSKRLALSRPNREPMDRHGGVLAAPSLADTANSRFVLNVSSNFCYLVLNTALMLWYMPFLLRHLGVGAYGMIPLANSLVMYATIISTGLDVSINRFLAIDLNQGNTAGANRTFNTALVLSVAACGSLLLPLGVFTYFFPALFNIPPGLEVATQFLFASVGTTMLVAILSGTFGVASLITHRFDLRNIIRGLTSVTRMGVVALAFMFWPATLWSVAFGFMASAGINLIGDVLVWRRLTPQLRIDYRNIDRNRFHALLGLSGWTAIGQVGFLLLSQADLLVVNALFGADSTGRYGAVLLLPSMVHMVVETVIVVLCPAIMAHYALGEIVVMQRLVSSSVKLLGIGLALPVGLLCGFASPVLSLWLGPEFAQLDLLLILLVGHLTVNSAVRPLAYVVTAYNRVKVQGVIGFMLGITNIGLAIALARWMGWGLGGVAAATAIVLTIKNAAFLPSYCAVVMGLRWWSLYPLLIPGALGTLGVTLTGQLASQLFQLTNWLALGAAATGISAAYCVTVYVISLSRSDRDLLWSLLHQKSHA